MSEAIAFDTHKFVKRLTAGGFTERQAEVLAEEQVNLLETNLATKADMAAVRADIAGIEAVSKADIAGIEAALKADIAALKADLEFKMSQLEVKVEASKTDLLKWMIGAMIAQGGLIIALIKLL